jgi:Fe-S oxidoreductase
MRMMTSPGLAQNRLSWVDADIEIARSGDVAFFAGCAPYFDVFFAGIEVDTLSIAKDSVRLLNFLDIKPVVLPNERCCGHDLLWTGDVENFEALCRLNYQSFREAGIREIIVSCPECFQMLGEYMPKVVPGFDIKVTLLMDLLRREMNKGGMSFRPLKRRATFQDPCRLVRMTDRSDVPRELLNLIPDMRFLEMENAGRNALCCGNCGFINCDAYSKQIQVKRLREAKATGADLLITACPKCMIHMTCTIRDRLRHGEKIKMELRDIVSILADQITYSG